MMMSAPVAVAMVMAVTVRMGMIMSSMIVVVLAELRRSHLVAALRCNDACRYGRKCRRILLHFAGGGRASQSWRRAGCANAAMAFCPDMLYESEQPVLLGDQAR